MNEKSELIDTPETKIISFSKDCILMANILGVEEFVLDYDFQQDPIILLNELKKDHSVEGVESNQEAENEILRLLARIALTTFYERIPSLNTNQLSYAELVDNAANKLEKNIKDIESEIQRRANILQVSYDDVSDEYPPLCHLFDISWEVGPPTCFLTSF